jgi:transcriptional regulator with XRE-family HTH domain
MSARVTCRCGWTKQYDTYAKAEFNARRHVCRAGQKKRVRRGAYHRRCARCGWEGTFDTAARADYAKGRHSCQKREMLMLRKALAEQREAMIDRTPKPCLHKQANHQHGTRACYVLDRCRCLPCAKANSKAETERERMKAYGRYHKYVPAGPVREHIDRLREAGMGLKTISARSGVSNGALTKIVYGTYAPAEGPHKGRNGAGTLLRGPARRVLRETAEKIYALDPDWNEPLHLADGARVPAHGTVLRIRALVALGWSQSKLAERLGVQRSNFRLTGTWQVEAATARAVVALYDELSMTLPPTDTHRDRIAASRAKRYAADRGWLPPLALDDDRLDDPGYEPWFEYDPNETDTRESA